MHNDNHVPGFSNRVWVKGKNGLFSSREPTKKEVNDRKLRRDDNDLYKLMKEIELKQVENRRKK